MDNGISHVEIIFMQLRSLFRRSKQPATHQIPKRIPDTFARQSHENRQPPFPSQAKFILPYTQNVKTSFNIIIQTVPTTSNSSVPFTFLLCKLRLALMRATCISRIHFLVSH